MPDGTRTSFVAVAADCSVRKCRLCRELFPLFLVIVTIPFPWWIYREGKVTETRVDGCCGGAACATVAASQGAPQQHLSARAALYFCLAIIGEAGWEQLGVTGQTAQRWRKAGIASSAAGGTWGAVTQLLSAGNRIFLYALTELNSGYFSRCCRLLVTLLCFWNVL